MITYAQAVERLYALGHELAAAAGSPRKFDLDHTRVLVEALGHPERSCRSVLIAGTNGKGSTSATLACILQQSGYRTGLYTSPHLVRPNERIQINGEPISDSNFTAMYERVEHVARTLLTGGKLALHPSFFEMVTAMAFEYFSREQIDIAVLEVGLGGRLDATNVAEPIVSVITDIDLDHQQWLGETIPRIAREKAGILRRNGVMVTLPQHPQANQAIGEVAVELGVRGVNAAEHIPDVSPTAQHESGEPNARFRNVYPLNVMGQDITVDSPLIGRHQLRNIALAIATAVELNRHGFTITAPQIERGVRETHWPGRLQYFEGSPAVLLDVAHNPAGAWALRSALSRYFEGRSITVIFGAMRDKAVAEMANILFPVCDQVIATHIDNPRALSPADLAQFAVLTGVTASTASSADEAIQRARNITPADGLIVITGSVYLVGAAISALRAHTPAAATLQ